MSQYSIPCVVYRGGTSRGLFFHEKDLPLDSEKKKEVFLSGIDAYNPSQIDGLGSGTSHSSKVVVISPSSKKGIDVDYTFYQVGMGDPIIDDKGTCGNLMAAVGAFAVDEGLVDCHHSAEDIDVFVFNRNVNMKLQIRVPVKNGKAKVTGHYLMPGLVKTGAKYMVNIMEPGGGKTGATLPLDSVYSLQVDENKYNITFLDVVNPFVHVASSSLGLSGTEHTQNISNNQTIMNRLDSIRNQATVAVGLARTREEAKYSSPAVPKITMVAVPQDYITTSGKQIKKEEVDIIAKMISMGKVHRTFAGSGLYNLASAVLLPGTIPNLLSNKEYGSGKQIIRIGHPDGIAEIQVSLTEDGKDVATVGLERTARRIMSGQLYIPDLV